MAKIKQITLPNGNTYDLLPDVLDGVTSNVQNQLNSKASSSHTHNYAGSSSAGGAATSANKLNTNAGSATQPVYFEGGIPKATTYTLGKSVPSNAVFTDTNTTYSAGAGISLSGTTFSNSGVRSIATGSTNGTISVNTNGTSAEVAVKGLGTAAYTASTAYAASSHNHSASNITSGTLSVDRLPTVTIAKGGTGATTAAEALSNLGLTATAAELNYCDGVTSNIQAQFDTLSSNKAEASALTRKGVTVSPLATSTYIDLGAYNVKKELTLVAGYVYFTAKSAINGGANLLSFSKPPLDLYYCPLINITDGKITYATINTSGQLKNGRALTAGKVYIVNVSYFTDTE